MGQAILRQLVTRHRPSKLPLPVSEHPSGAAIYARTQEGGEGSRGDSPSLRSCVVPQLPLPLYPQDSTGQTSLTPELLQEQRPPGTCLTLTLATLEEYAHRAFYFPLFSSLRTFSTISIRYFHNEKNMSNILPTRWL